MVCGVLGCDRWWMSLSRQCSLRPEVASELPVPTNSAGRPGERRAESLVQEGKWKEWLDWKVASQREITYNHGRGAVGRAVGGGSQEEDSYCSKEGAALRAEHSCERRTSGESSAPGDGWLSWSLSKLQVTVCAQVCWDNTCPRGIVLEDTCPRGGRGKD